MLAKIHHHWSFQWWWCNLHHGAYIGSMRLFFGGSLHFTLSVSSGAEREVQQRWSAQHGALLPPGGAFALTHVYCALLFLQCILPLTHALVYCASCTCLFAFLQQCEFCARVCNVHGAPLSPGGLLHSPLVTLLPLARWQHCALCAFSHGKRLLLHAHFCILHSAILYLHCICIHISAQVHCSPLGGASCYKALFCSRVTAFYISFSLLSASHFYYKSQINQALESPF